MVSTVTSTMYVHTSNRKYFLLNIEYSFKICFFIEIKKNCKLLKFLNLFNNTSLLINVFSKFYNLSMPIYAQVGGEISSTIIYQMRTFGRIAVCGSISEYNKDLNDITKSTQIQIAMLLHELKMEGFIVKRWDDTVSEDFQNILQMVRNGKLKYRETVTVGFENMFDAFVGMLNGDNIGKAIVKACDE